MQANNDEFSVHIEFLVWETTGSIDAGCQSMSKRKRIIGQVIGSGFGVEYNPLCARSTQKGEWYKNAGREKNSDRRNRPPTAKNNGDSPIIERNPLCIASSNQIFLPKCRASCRDSTLNEWLITISPHRFHFGNFQKIRQKIDKAYKVFRKILDF